jgi:hypothetical protein
MNLSIDLHKFSLVNVLFSDTKRNMIMDGNFTKIIYSNQWFTMNSLYLYFPIEGKIEGFSKSSSVDIAQQSDRRSSARITSKDDDNDSLLSSKFGGFSVGSPQRGLQPCTTKGGAEEPRSGIEKSQEKSMEDLGLAKQPLVPPVKTSEKLTQKWAHSANFIDDSNNNNNNIIKNNRCSIKFNPYSPKNIGIIQDIVKIESRILEYFKTYFNINPRINNLLSKQLYTGNMKIFPDNSNIFETELDNNKIFVIKISGIWENYEEIGITYKLLEQSSISSSVDTGEFPSPRIASFACRGKPISSIDIAHRAISTDDALKSF